MLREEPMRAGYEPVPSLRDNAQTRWEIRYWTDPDLSGSPRRESFDSPDEARARREEVMAKGHPTHLRLFPSPK